MQTVYLDNQATTPCDPRVLAVMRPWLEEEFGNPHSTSHEKGQKAATAVEKARAQIAQLIGADSREIIFTSGATEANNLAIKGVSRFMARHKTESPKRIITLASEHKCVLESVLSLGEEGFEPVILNPQSDGLIHWPAFEKAMEVPTLLVSIMLANNETGVIQDIQAIAEYVHAKGALLHVDMAQAAGKIPIDIQALGVDLASLSAHKMYGPKGVGTLYVRRRPRVRLTPLFSGGGQERGLRSGTLPTPLIVGMGMAAHLASEEMEEEQKRLLGLRKAFLEGLQNHIPGLEVNGTMQSRLAGNLNLSFPHIRALDLMAQAPHIYLSTGSACTSAEVSPSYVLKAMGISSEKAAGSLRVSLGRFTTHEEVLYAVNALVDAYQVVSTLVKE